MTTDNSGFSFGKAGGHHDHEVDDIEAVEVSGEPVSRSEASNMGLTAVEPNRDSKGATALLRKDLLPLDISHEITAKLELAWRYLRKNETTEALTLAQEVVWESPDLIPPKLIISRCFINRKEYDKSLAILSAIPEEQRNAEVQYYLGLTNSRMGRIREALAALKRARNEATDPTVRKQVGDLLMQLQGEQTTCPKCGKKTLYDSMVEVGDQTVCANCAASMAEEADRENQEEAEEDDTKTVGKRRKRLRPPLSRTDMLIRGLFALFMLALVLVGGYLLSILAPDTYASLRSFLPGGWSFIPGGQVAKKPQTPVPATAAAPKPTQTLTIDSLPLTRAVAGVELRHRLSLRETQFQRDGRFNVTISPQPTGPFSLTPDTGDFVWTPSEKDAGKTFSITFGGAFGATQAKNQVCNVAVSSSPRFRNICTFTTRKPGEITHLVPHDFIGNGEMELTVVAGQFWEGVITSYKTTPDGFLTQLSSTNFPGRPAGAGVIKAADEDWLAVADFWNSRLRHFAYRSGQMAEVAVDVDLPGRPILAAFDRESATSAILCRQADKVGVYLYRQEGQYESVPAGEWQIPADLVWKRIVIVPKSEKSPLLPILCGGTGKRGIFLLDMEKQKLVPVTLEVDGNLVDAAIGPDGKVYCLFQKADKLQIASFTPHLEKGAEGVAVMDGGIAPALAGLAAINFSGDSQLPDVAIFSTGNLALSVGYTAKDRSKPAYWPLPKPARLSGSPAILPGKGGKGNRLAFMDAERDIWAVSLPGAKE